MRHRETIQKLYANLNTKMQNQKESFFKRLNKNRKDVEIDKNQPVATKFHLRSKTANKFSYLEINSMIKTEKSLHRT